MEKLGVYKKIHMTELEILKEISKMDLSNFEEDIITEIIHNSFNKQFEI